MKRYIFMLFAASTACTGKAAFHPTTTNPYDVGIPDADLVTYSTDGQEEQSRLTSKYSDISKMTREELGEFIRNRIMNRTYSKRLDNAMSDLDENVQLASIPHVLLGIGGAGIAHFGRLKALDKHPNTKHTSTILLGGLGLLGGSALSYVFSRIKTYLRKEIGQIVAFLQLDNKTMHTLVRSRQHRLKIADIGLPRPFGSDELRLRFPADVAAAIEQFEEQFPPQSFTSDDEGGKKLRLFIQPLLKKRIQKLTLLFRTLLPLAAANWTMLGANLWAYPGTLVGKEMAAQQRRAGRPTAPGASPE